MASAPRVVHVYVALCDNANQGIVPVPAHLGRGDSPSSNLYWGAAYGVRTFFRKHADWEEVRVSAGPRKEVLERVVFRHRTEDVWMVADAYNGADLRTALEDFLAAAGGLRTERLHVAHARRSLEFEAGGASALVVFIGHNGLMDFKVSRPPPPAAGNAKQAVILACASKPYFSDLLRETGAEPLLWTTGLMAPEAYVLAATLAAWIRNEPPARVRELAAQAYCRYQRCTQRAGLRLFASGW